MRFKENDDPGQVFIFQAKDRQPGQDMILIRREDGDEDKAFNDAIGLTEKPTALVLVGSMPVYAMAKITVGVPKTQLPPMQAASALKFVEEEYGDKLTLTERKSLSTIRHKIVNLLIDSMF